MSILTTISTSLHFDSIGEHLTTAANFFIDCLSMPWKSNRQHTEQWFETSVAKNRVTTRYRGYASQVDTPNKNIAGKRIARQNLSAYLRKPVDALAKIRGLNRQQYSHLRCNLDHDKNAFSTVSSAGGCPFPVTHRRLPSARSHSICHRLATAPISISINCSGEWGSSGILFLRSA